MNIGTIEPSMNIFPSHILTDTVDFDSCRDSLLETARSFLDCQLQRVQQMNDHGGSGQQIVKELTAVFDQLINSLYWAVSANLSKEEVADCALIALGGYGRAEMNPRSDLDLMFFCLLYTSPSPRDS